MDLGGDEPRRNTVAAHVGGEHEGDVLAQPRNRGLGRRVGIKPWQRRRRPSSAEGDYSSAVGAQRGQTRLNRKERPENVDLERAAKVGHRVRADRADRVEHAGRAYKSRHVREVRREPPPRPLVRDVQSKYLVSVLRKLAADTAQGVLVAGDKHKT